MLHREIPFLRIIVPLCAGIISGLFFRPVNIFFVISSGIIIILFSISLYFNRSLSNSVYGMTLTLAFFCSGLLLYTREKQNLSTLDPVEAVYSGVLDDYPEEKENTFSMVIKLENRTDNGRLTTARGSIMLYHRKGADISSFMPGDRIMIRCTPLAITNRGNPFEFNYRFYMENHGVRYYAFTDSMDIVRHITPEHRKLRYSALIIRERIIGMFSERGISGERLALVSAITLGQKNLLDPEQKQYFIKAGIMHIMAVSGLHAMILSLSVFRMLFFLKKRLNILRVFITILILWAFAFVTGLTPSVIRASLMFTFLHAGMLMKRPVNGINSVLASAFILILIRPSVIFDSGFLLSYSAVIYIISFYRILYGKLRFSHRIPDLIWKSAAVSIIAQTGTLPLTIMFFNRFPVWFILSNIVIVPIATLVIICGCLVPLTFPLKFLSLIIARVLNFLTGLTEALTEKAASLPFATIENIGTTTIECVLLMLTIYIFTQFLLKRKSVSVFLPAGALLLFISVALSRDIMVRRSNELIVYNTTGSTTIGIRTGKILNIYSADTGLREVDRHCAVLKLRQKCNNPVNDYFLLKAGSEKILITDKLSNSFLEETAPDFVILKGTRPEIENNIRQEKALPKIISSAEVSSSFRLQLSFNDSDIVHYVRNEGAFSTRLKKR